MKGLVLYGAKCDGSIWQPVKEKLSKYDLEYVVYSHEVLQVATSVRDIAKWVVSVYGNDFYDVLIGHSMGGQVALELLPLLNMRPQKVILIDSNPVPSGAFYRSLMTKEHMEQYGEKIREMFERESPHYSQKLLQSLGDDFNLLENIRAYPGKIYSIYGDRGQADDKRCYEDLCLPDDVFKKMKIYFVREACHLPMIENDTELVEILTEILEQEPDD